MLMDVKVKQKLRFIRNYCRNKSIYGKCFNNNQNCTIAHLFFVGILKVKIVFKY